MKTPISLADTKANKVQQDKAAMQDAIKVMVELMPEQIKIYALQAQAMRARQDALIKQGFTEEQALEIVKTRPIFE